MLLARGALRMPNIKNETNLMLGSFMVLQLPEARAEIHRTLLSHFNLLVEDFTVELQSKTMIVEF